MKTDLHSKNGERQQFFIQISEFSFAAYPVHINHVFRCLPDTATPPNKSRNLRRNALSRRISQLLRWMSGKPPAAPVAENLSQEQAVP